MVQKIWYQADSGQGANQMAEETPKKSEFRKSIEEAIDAKITPRFDDVDKRFDSIDRTLTEIKNALGPQPPKV